ncbi:hypothetical protein KFE94_14820 [bacterium SCSIO 12643]|nr:hypothetical protein KFE94_14820 [bacterium SCSIO 12643]
MSSEVLPVEKRVYVKDLSFDHELWDNEMKFYRNELEIFDHRLEQDVVRLSEQEALRELEHFQNQFIRQNEVLDILNKRVRQNRKSITRNSVDGEIKNNDEIINEYNSLRDEFETFERIYADLKKNFLDFNHKHF